MTGSSASPPRAGLSSPRHRKAERSLHPGGARMDARSFDAKETKPHGGWRPDRCDRIALVLQGGGALGAYQAGVYQALEEANIEPDWVSGVSIGAVNAAIIAGNPP